MTTTTKRPVLTVELLEPVRDGSALVRITLGKKSDLYWLDPIGSDFGRAFNVTKVEPPADPAQDRAYRLCIESEQDHWCECRGHVAHGACKHVRAILELLADGRL